MLTSGRPLRRRNTPTSPRMPWRERLDLSWQSNLAKGKTRIYIYIHTSYMNIYNIYIWYIYMIYDIYIILLCLIYIYIYLHIYIIISYKKSISVVINWWERISLFFFLTFSASFGGFGPRGIDFVSLRNRRFLGMSNWENCADPSSIFSDGREWAAGLDGMMHEIHWNPRKVTID